MAGERNTRELKAVTLNLFKEDVEYATALFRDAGGYGPFFRAWINEKLRELKEKQNVMVPPFD